MKLHENMEIVKSPFWAHIILRKHNGPNISYFKSPYFCSKDLAIWPTFYRAILYIVHGEQVQKWTKCNVESSCVLVSETAVCAVTASPPSEVRYYVMYIQQYSEGDGNMYLCTSARNKDDTCMYYRFTKRLAILT